MRRCVTVFLLTPDKHVWLARNIEPGSTYFGFLLPPSGTVDQRDRTPAEAVRREAKEEFGVRILRMYLAGIVELPDRDILLYAFVATDWRGQLRGSPENDAPVLVPVKKLATTIWPDAKRWVDKVIAHRKGDPIFRALVIETPRSFKTIRVVHLPPQTSRKRLAS